MINILNHNTSYKHSKFSARPFYAININRVIEIPKFNFSLPFSCEKAQANTLEKKSKLLFESSCKELLCWRYDLTYLNLHGFFLNMLKALHTCWTFTRNHQTIIFVSSNNPIDNGTSSAINKLVQNYPRALLPRIKVNKSQKVEKANTTLKLDNKPLSTNKKVKIKKVKKINVPKLSKIKSQKKNQNLLSQLRYFVLASIRSNLKSPSPIVKSNDSISSSIKLSPNVFHRKLEGLLYKASSRRLITSFGGALTHMFSNVKTSFSEKFGHLNNRETKNKSYDNNISLNGPKIEFALNLDKTAIIKPYSNSDNDNLEINLFSRGPIKSKYNIMYDSNASNTTSKPLRETFLKQKIGLDILLKQKNSKDNAGFDLLEEKTTLEEEIREILNSKFSTFALASSNVKSKVKKIQQPYLANNIKNKQGFTNRKLSFNVSRKNRRVVKSSYRSYDCYSKLLDLQRSDASKRLAINPYLEHADLVFFTNADRDCGLASQIKRLGIPSIGIVSGLKTSSYRKQPHLFNLNHDITFPIVGNPENLGFVTMVVQVFVRLIQKSYRTQRKNRRF